MSDARPSPDAQAICSLRLQLLNAEQQLIDGLTAVKRALKTLEVWECSSLQTETATTPTERAIALRRARGGRKKPFKIETDPELEDFIRERITRLKFVQIAAEVAAAFPPDRRTSKSGISRWWAKVGPKPCN